MSMSKKDFIELADYVRGIQPTPNEYGQGIYHAGDGFIAATKQWEVTRDALARFCSRQNPRFNRERWLGYIAGECGPSGGIVPPCARAMGCLCAFHTRNPKSKKACDAREQ